MDEPEEIVIPTQTRSRYAIAYGKFDAASGPSVTDDQAHGYDVNSIWYKPDVGLWICVDATPNAAIWRRISLEDDNAYTNDALANYTNDALEVYTGV